MDTAILVDTYIEDGKKLIKKLDDYGFPVNSALWLYLSDVEEWRLLIASKKVDKDGPIQSYKHIYSILKNLKIHLELTNISVISPTNNLIKLFRKAVHTSPSDISGIRFKSNTIDNHYIENSYVYRVS